MSVIISDLNLTKFSLNGVDHVKNYMALVKGSSVYIVNTYDSRLVIAKDHFSAFTLNGSSYASAEDLASALSSVLFVKASEITLGGESSSGSGSTYFGDVFGRFVNSPTNPVTGTIILSNAGAVNGGVCAVYFKAATLTFSGGTIVVQSGAITANELCIVWIIYDKTNNAYSVNIQKGATGETPPAVSVPDAPTALVLTEGTTGAPVINTPDAPTALILTEGVIINTPDAPTALVLTEGTTI